MEPAQVCQRVLTAASKLGCLLEDLPGPPAGCEEWPCSECWTAGATLDACEYMLDQTALAGVSVSEQVVAQCEEDLLDADPWDGTCGVFAWGNWCLNPMGTFACSEACDATRVFEFCSAELKQCPIDDHYCP